MAYDESQRWYERARKSLAGGVSSHFRALGYPHPMFYTHGRGSRLYDVDGNEYIDYVLGQGPDVLGHAPQGLVDAVSEAVARGQIFAGQIDLEVECAEMVCEMVPSADRVRFSLSGSEVDQAAMRIARGITGRAKIVRFEGHYHGWFDNVAWSINPPLDQAGPEESPTPVAWTKGMTRSSGDDLIVLPWNNLELVQRTVEKRADEIAAIITEPIMCNTNCIEPNSGYLQGLRDLCSAHDVCLIFDEVITGFRTAPGGAQAMYGVTPDLSVFGKACAAGYPTSVLAGTRKWMEPVAAGEIIHAGTLNANVPCMAATKYTLEQLRGADAPHERLFRLGRKLRNGLAERGSAKGHTVLAQGPGPMFWFGFTDGEPITDYRSHVRHADMAKTSEWTRLLHDRGVRMIGRGLWYLSAAHTDDDIDRTLDIADEVLELMR